MTKLRSHQLASISWAVNKLSQMNVVEKMGLDDRVAALWTALSMQSVATRTKHQNARPKTGDYNQTSQARAWALITLNITVRPSHSSSLLAFLEQ